jgi:hypothetical protein
MYAFISLLCFLFHSLFFFLQFFVYKIINIADEDTENLGAYFDECVKFIDGVVLQNGKVLIHWFDCLFSLVFFL